MRKLTVLAMTAMMSLGVWGQASATVIRESFPRAGLSYRIESDSNGAVDVRVRNLDTGKYVDVTIRADYTNDRLSVFVSDPR